MDATRREGLGIMMIGVALLISGIQIVLGVGAYEGIGRILIGAGGVVVPVCLVGMGALILSGRIGPADETPTKTAIAALLTVMLVVIATGVVVAWTG